MANGIYFKREEYQETIKNNQPYDKDAQLITTTYNYQCSGAVYTGQMRGCFREGTGTMIWPDGAKFEGQWKEGFANGKGIFYHIDGDVYDG